MLTLIMLIAALTELLTVGVGSIAESYVLAVLSGGAVVWAVVLGALLVDARYASA